MGCPGAGRRTRVETLGTWQPKKRRGGNGLETGSTYHPQRSARRRFSRGVQEEGLRDGRRGRQGFWEEELLAAGEGDAGRGAKGGSAVGSGSAAAAAVSTVGGMADEEPPSAGLVVSCGRGPQGVGGSGRPRGASEGRHWALEVGARRRGWAGWPPSRCAGRAGAGDAAQESWDQYGAGRAGRSRARGGRAV